MSVRIGRNLIGEKRWGSTWVLGARQLVPARNDHLTGSLKKSCGCLEGKRLGSLKCEEYTTQTGSAQAIELLPCTTYYTWHGSSSSHRVNTVQRPTDPANNLSS